MTSTSLNKLIQRSYLRSVLVPLLIVESALVGMYFTVVFLITDQQMALALKQATENLKTITQQQAKQLDLNIQEVSRNASQLQQQFNYLFQTRPHANEVDVDEGYRFHDNGALYRPQPTNGSAFYYSTLHGLDQQSLIRAKWSEQMEPLLKGITDTNPIIAQSYFNSWDSMVRLYPPVDNLPELFGAVMDIRQQPFYYLADAQHNPQRTSVWTQAYFDPLGMGWIITAMAPVYSAQRLEGVAGIDVSIAELAVQVIESELPWQASSLLLDKQGNILAIDPDINATLGVEVVAGQEFAGLMQKSVERKSEFDLLSFRSDPIKQFFSGFLSQNQTLQALDIDNKRYLVLGASVPSTQWHVIAMVDESNLYSEALTTEAKTIRIGFLAIGALALFYMLFIYFAKRRSRTLSKKIAEPIQALSRLTSDIEANNEFQPVATGINELDQLQENFKVMTTQLNERQQHLLESKLEGRVQQERANLMKQLSETDSLTSLSNRRKLDDILASEIGRASRYDTPLSIILADIDHFKRVNDKHGHLKGDEVISRVAQLLKHHTRETDTVGRWGGEEFLLICPGIEQQSATELAEKIREMIAAEKQNGDIAVTASFGVSQYRQQDTVDSLVSRADKALYNSKQSGRNQVSAAQ
ncbi:sensor domain-containing diguanylate cyclase [Lacimicrobium sp. SS2-24]|uniref:sensor domain-containing diguanylate cyclase n=1 Tax=Lacimicrobium sp. SS2-24 TaxID=2005569 RepID=UPI000B4AD712|nr:sensor domain-containing diguanylate cyclase [Lacimicrobium sp. SS2-24]